MTAKEMFNELGYSQIKSYVFMDMITKRMIAFKSSTRQIEISTLFVNDVTDLELSESEKESIKQQMKELGWIK